MSKEITHSKTHSHIICGQSHLWHSFMIKIKSKKKGAICLHSYDNKNVRTQLKQWQKSVAHQIRKWLLNGVSEFRGVPREKGRRNVHPGVRWSAQNFILEQTLLRLMLNNCSSPRLLSWEVFKVFLNGTVHVLKEKPSQKQAPSPHCQ